MLPERQNPIVSYKNSTIENRMISVEESSWGCWFKPGDLMKSTDREFPISRLYHFVKKQHKAELRWLSPMHLLEEPVSWPARWVLVPIRELPLEHFNVPPLLFLGKVFRMDNMKKWGRHRSGISSMFTELHESDALLGFLFMDKEVYVPSCEMKNFVLVDG